MSKSILIPQDITDTGKNYLRERGYDVIMGSGFDEDTICREIADCDGVLVRTASYTRKIFEAAKNLKVMGRFGAGVDNIDLEAATEFGVQVTNAPVANCNSVAEHTIAFILASAMRIPFQDRAARDGNWEYRNKYLCMEIKGKVLGVIGLGHIGRLVAEKAHALGMNIIGYDAILPVEKYPAYVTPVSQEDIFRNSDFVTLHVPVLPSTKGFVNSSTLSLMKKSAILINCSRGMVINEIDLHNALVNGLIAGAALDVLIDEPPKKDNPFLKLENVILSPHNAALTYEAMDMMGLNAAMGIDEVLTGKPVSWPVNKLKR